MGFIGVAQKGPFDIEDATAIKFLYDANPYGKTNSDVLRPTFNAKDVTTRPRNSWNIDFGLARSLEDSALYVQPFEHVKKVVYPLRVDHREARQTRYWWLFARPCPDMRNALVGLPRFIATPRVSKHRVFAWLTPEVLCDSALVIFARPDDYHLGILHSRPHEVWARAQGTQVRERESGFRYTPTTCFETFPFPEPSDDQMVAVAEAAKQLDAMRSGWLNPPEWTREEVLEFPGSVDGPWSRYVHEPDHRGIGTVRYPRVIPRDRACAAMLAKRTLTNLYNARPTWLDLAHRRLDEAVFAAYGLDPATSDEGLLAALLELNLRRRPAGAPPVDDPAEDDDAGS